MIRVRLQAGELHHLWHSPDSNCQNVRLVVVVLLVLFVVQLESSFNWLLSTSSGRSSAVS